ncbi:MAG: glycosyltransferase family 2 protein [Methylococcaceae bacterium]|nr:glycosyltransferase family 2 protein [Methylococcaceae bacterium]
MSHSIKLSIVFLNFNKLTETQFTCTTLQSLCAERSDIEIIAVDNGSEDGTNEYLQAQAHIISLSLPDNQGIAGYNQGFELARGEHILVLDDDSCPANLAGIDHALSILDQRADIGVIAAHIKMPDGKPQWSWHLPKSEVFGVSPFFIGCGFIIRRDLFAKIGWYPDDFFLYQNEIDVSFQVRMQGFEIFYDPECVVIHRGSPSQRPNWRRIFFPTRNTLWLIRRYYPQPLASYMMGSRIIIGLTRALCFRELRYYFKALKAGLFTPIQKTILPHMLRNQKDVFFRQNSLLHQLLLKFRGSFAP